jgi:uncharacterized membrane protein YgaE (UPF0421/DUF939 family)
VSLKPKPEDLPIELVRPSFYGMLVCYYAAIMGYGITAYLFGVLSIQHTNGATFAIIWAILLGCGAVLAVAGVFVSLLRRSHWLELVGTIVIVALMVGYAVSIILYAVSTHSLTRISATWLPVLISIMPIWRIAVMATDGSLGRHRVS